MAIVSDRKMIYERKIAELQAQLTEVRGSERGWIQWRRDRESFFILLLSASEATCIMRQQLSKVGDHKALLHWKWRERKKWGKKCFVDFIYSFFFLFFFSPISNTMGQRGTRLSVMLMDRVVKILSSHLITLQFQTQLNQNNMQNRVRLWGYATETDCTCHVVITTGKNGLKHGACLNINKYRYNKQIYNGIR